MELTHRKARTYLQAASDSRLSDSQRIALDRHLADCPACRDYAASLSGLESLLAQGLHARQPQPRASERVKTRIIHAIEAQRKPSMNTKPVHFLRPLVLGIIVIVFALAIGLGIRAFIARPVMPAATAAIPVVEETSLPTSEPTQLVETPTPLPPAVSVPGNGSSYQPVMSADGGVIVFHSEAMNLTSDNPPHNLAGDMYVDVRNDLYVFDRQTAEMKSINPASDKVYFHQSEALSGDGRYLVTVGVKAQGFNELNVVAILDRQTGEYEIVLPPQDDPRLANVAFSASEAVISTDGRWVVFWGINRNVWDGEDTSKCLDNCLYYFIHDRETGDTERIELTPRVFADVGISDDGRYLTLTTGSWGDGGAYVYDRETQNLELISVALDDAPTDGASMTPKLSADGRYAAFYSENSNLVPDDTNGVGDIFVRDRQAGTTQRVSVSGSGEQANGRSYNSLAISADGRFVVYWSFATNLSPDLSEACAGVDGIDTVCPVLYRYDIETGRTEVIYEGGVRPNVDSRQTWETGEIVFWFPPAVSQSGRLIAFTGYSDEPKTSQIYLFDVETGVTELISKADAQLASEPEPVETPALPLESVADGAPVNLTNSPEVDTLPAWSPDGSRLVFVTIGEDGSSGDIRLMNADGNGLTTLAGGPSNEDMPAWSPDGQRIAFLSDRTGKNEIYIVRPDGTDLQQLTDTTAVPMGFLDWSPDGTRIAALFYEGDQCNLYIVSAGGSGLNRLTENPMDYAVTHWSADSHSISVVSMNGGAVNISVMDVYSLQKRVVGSLPAGASEIYWSPDGSKIAYVIPPTESDAAEPPGLYIANADGSDPLRLTEMDALSPHWSPDGTRIAFLAGDPESKIYLINTDGSGLSNLNTGSSLLEYWPAWSPDGTRIAFMARTTDIDDMGMEIYVTELAGAP